MIVGNPYWAAVSDDDEVVGCYLKEKIVLDNAKWIIEWYGGGGVSVQLKIFKHYLYQWREF